ncbi:hypothetical protein MD588_13155 [Photobacterium sp. SDRW27]|uniref:hypothetical protein n=1 Tax=Photobacterium obscurum TaxID=2829490 RepID=UPI00224489B8|nr:hypothetical protein [Photobacterium obscurum]MCW8329759.1 hypothetical protein [Photobacterium obscurum]
MNSLKTSSIALAIAGLLITSTSYADNTASAYTGNGTAVIGALASRAMLADDEGYTRVLSTELSNSGAPKDLVIGLSFETSLFTETVVKSKGGTKSSSTADAKIEMKVYVDGVLAQPGNVIFDKRTQTLWAKLGGSLNCEDTNDDGIISFDECDLTEEEIGLILDTTAAHTFNFLAYDIGSGSHTIEAFARLSYGGEVVVEDPESGSGSWDANATLGKGTLSVWEVHGSNAN